MMRNYRGWIGAASVLTLLALPTSSLADAAAGEKVFVKECETCHSVISDQSVTGPSLQGVVGRKAGTLTNWDYSKALKGSGIVWTPDVLEKWLADPHGKVAETDMPYTGLKDAAARKDLVQYLQAASAKKK